MDGVISFWFKKYVILDFKVNIDKYRWEPKAKKKWKLAIKIARIFIETSSFYFYWSKDWKININKYHVYENSIWAFFSQIRVQKFCRNENVQLK